MNREPRANSAIVAYTVFAILLCALELLIFAALSIRVLEIHRQQLGWDSATFIADSLATLDARQEEANQQLAQVSSAFPDLGLYVLSSRGEILTAPTETITRRSIDLQPIRQALLSPAPNLPLKAQDPKSQHHSALFSVAPLRIGTDEGYLYVTLSSPFLKGSQIQENMFSLLRNLFFVLLPGFLLICGLAILLSSYVRYRLRRVNRLLMPSRSPYAAPKLPWFRDELSELCEEIILISEASRREVIALESLRAKRKDVLLELLHDLRAPIVGMSAGAEMLRRDWNKFEEVEQNAIHQAFETGFCTQQRYVSKFTEGELLQLTQEQVPLGPTDISPLILSIASRSGPQAAQKGIQIALQLPKAPLLVIGNSDLLERAVTNLVQNALQYTSNGGVVQLSAQKTEGGVEITVSDSGAGIAAEELPLVFKAFYRGQSGEHFHQSGVGLGLAIVQKVIELHGTSLEVRSELHQGTHISFVLSAYLESGDQVAPATQTLWSRCVSRVARLGVEDGLQMLLPLFFFLSFPAYPENSWCILLGILFPFVVLRRMFDLTFDCRRGLQFVHLWWISAFILCPQNNPNTIAFFVFWLLFGYLCASKFVDARRDILGSLAQLIVLAFAAVFLKNLVRPELPSVILAFGVFLGFIAAYAKRLRGELGLVLRVVSLYSIIGVFILAWVVLSIDHLWRQLATTATHASNFPSLTFAPATLTQSLSQFYLGGDISRLVFRKVSEPYLILLAFSTILMSGIACAFLISFVAPVFRQTIRSLRSGISTLGDELSRGKAFDPCVAIPFPALLSFTQHVRSVREDSHRDQERVGGIVFGFARELSFLLREKMSLARQIQEGRQVHPENRPSTHLNAFLAILTIERKMIDYFFGRLQQEAQGKVGSAAQRSGFANLEDIADDLLIELAAFASRRSVVIAREIRSSAKVPDCSTEALKEPLFALLSAALTDEDAENISRVDLTVEAESESNVLVIMFSYSNPSPQHQEPRRERGLCILALEELEELGAEVTRNRDQSSETWRINFH